MSKSLVEMASDIVKSQSSATGMSADDLQDSLKGVFKVLQELQAVEAGGGEVSGDPAVDKAPAISPEKSIQKNKIVCLECGDEFRMLSPKHLKSHGLTGREYRVKHGFSLRQPLCAKALSDRRKKAGKARGLPDNLKKSIAARRKKAPSRAKKAAAKK